MFWDAMPEAAGAAEMTRQWTSDSLNDYARKRIQSGRRSTSTCLCAASETVTDIVMNMAQKEADGCIPAATQESTREIPD